MNTSPLIPSFPHLLHGGDYNPDQWLHAPEVIEEDFRLMKLAGCNTFSLGIFAWTSLEPSDGVFTFDWLDAIMDRMAAEGFKVNLATPSGSKPAWLAQAHPEICRVNRQGQREPHGARHNHCWTSPVFRDRIRRINRELASRYGKHPALATWHISNEYGGDCNCPLCLARWQEWLKEKYLTLEALNSAWWTTFWSRTYTDWSQILPSEWSHDGLMLDWMRFNTRQMTDFFQWEVGPLRELTPDIPCTTNFMGLSNGHDYAAFAKVVDFVADDQYPRYSDLDSDLLEKVNTVAFKDDLYRCFKPDSAWILMESCPEDPCYSGTMSGLKRPHLHRAEMLQALGHGAEGTLYFQWRKGRGAHEKFHGAVLDHAGHEHTRTFRDVAALGRSYQKFTPFLGSRTPAAEVAVVYDWEARWSFQFSPTANGNNAYDRIAVSHYTPFREAGMPVDVISSERDFSSYKVLILPQLWMLKPGVATRLRAFVEAGGTLIGTYYTGAVNETGLCWTGGFPGDGLMDVFGLWNEETDLLGEDRTQTIRITTGQEFPQSTYLARQVSSLCQLRGAIALAEYTEDFYAGFPALSVHELGKGRAYYQAARLGLDFQRAFYGQLIQQLGLSRPVPGPIPEGVQLQERRNAQARFLFLQNFSGESQAILLGKGAWSELETNEAVEETYQIKPWSSVILQAPVT